MLPKAVTSPQKKGRIKMSEAIKTRKYAITLNGETYHHRVELHESGAFQYGNQTCVAHYDGLNPNPTVYDTRYESGIVSNFEKWADDFIKNWCNPKCEIKVDEA